MLCPSFLQFFPFRQKSLTGRLEVSCVEPFFTFFYYCFLIDPLFSVIYIPFVISSGVNHYPCSWRYPFTALLLCFYIIIFHQFLLILLTTNPSTPQILSIKLSTADGLLGIFKITCTLIHAQGLFSLYTFGLNQPLSMF